MATKKFEYKGYTIQIKPFKDDSVTEPTLSITVFKTGEKMPEIGAHATGKNKMKESIVWGHRRAAQLFADNNPQTMTIVGLNGDRGGCTRFVIRLSWAGVNFDSETVHTLEEISAKYNISTKELENLIELPSYYGN